MNILSKSPNVKVSSFKKSAEGAVALFSKALVELRSVNQKIDSEATLTSAEIEKLVVFNSELAQQKEANEKIIAKISNIIEG
jgi:hypothetical protein